MGTKKGQVRKTARRAYVRNYEKQSALGIYPIPSFKKWLKMK